MLSMGATISAARYRRHRCRLGRSRRPLEVGCLEPSSERSRLNCIDLEAMVGRVRLACSLSGAARPEGIGRQRRCCCLLCCRFEPRSRLVFKEGIKSGFLSECLSLWCGRRRKSGTLELDWGHNKPRALLTATSEQEKKKKDRFDGAAAIQVPLVVVVVASARSWPALRPYFTRLCLARRPSGKLNPVVVVRPAKVRPKRAAEVACEWTKLELGRRCNGLLTLCCPARQQVANRRPPQLARLEYFTPNKLSQVVAPSRAESSRDHFSRHRPTKQCIRLELELEKHTRAECVPQRKQ